MDLVACGQEFPWRCRCHDNDSEVMNQRTLNQLKELKAFPWFVNVGKPAGGDFLVVPSWIEAVDLCVGEVWTSVQHQVKNQIAEEVTLKDYWRSEEWNDVAAQLEGEIFAIVEPLQKSLRMNPRVGDSIRWDLFMICLESEFSDLVEPMFFMRRLKPVYAAGHFPCGWEGPKLDAYWQGGLLDWRLWVY
jgi:hypothetical protein